ncbi:SGNH/GDSL hydrolase family protein [Salinarchaeum laminariae]|uniref:SGNH/GDSL hydrolase family protein n=1 Tax=Salinarchaeum laminariae TaxID=869888 RepID=UPI0020BF8C5B|nr:SGNH/GDSL hydrolase family protein [Salinarchaeum laminariae]
MESDVYPSVSPHNVAELDSAEWAVDGHRFARIPDTVGANLNVAARERLRHPTGCELRFVPDAAGSVEITLSAPERTVVWPFWGEFQPTEPIEVGPTPTTADFEVPDRIQNLDVDGGDTAAFDPRVCRLRFADAAPVALHDVAGPCRPPTVDERPDRRYLAYGTSITEGAGAAPHLTYVAQAARALGVDPINLGTSGSAFCEPAMAEYIADREDWDVATLALSVNMANRGFTLAQFRHRARTLINTVASAHPETPVVCITLFPYHADLVRGDDAERAEAFRHALQTIVAESANENVEIVEGSELLEPTGLTTDVLHPGDHGLAQIGRRLADRIAQLPE